MIGSTLKQSNQMISRVQQLADGSGIYFMHTVGDAAVIACDILDTFFLYSICPL